MILRTLGTPCLIHQPSYSMINRWVEGGLLDTLEREGIGCIAFSPLAQGMLTDKYLEGIPADSRVARGGALRREFLSADNLARIRSLDAIARRRDQNLAQMALAWVLKDQRITSVIIGASRPAQIEDCVRALAQPAFAAEELAEIDRHALDAGVDLWTRSRRA
jgi:L-glyceraldehyde 3-phosphate reductase